MPFGNRGSAAPEEDTVLNVGIVGFGGWGRRLVSAVQGKSGRIRFAAAATRTPSRVRDFATAQGIALRDSFEALLADPAISGIVVAGPAQLHAEHAMAAIEAGKHTMVIKPLALRKSDAEALAAAARAKGVLLALGYDRCFTPAIDELRRRIAAGDLGRILHAEGNFCVDRYVGLASDDWKADAYRAMPGGLADHMLYAMIELIGPVEELQVHGLRQVSTLDLADTAMVSLLFDHATSGSLTAIGVTPTFERLHFFGSKGWAEIRGGNRFEFRPLEGRSTVTEFEPFDALKKQLETFAAAVAGEATYPVSPANAVAGVAALEAMGKSLASGTAIAP